MGRSGLKLSALSFGSWITFGHQLHEAHARRCMHLAYDHGVNFFDTAEVYGGGAAERMMGRILRNARWPRDAFCISSKVRASGDRPTQIGLHRKHIFDACHASLQRLKLDYLDVYFCHRSDPDTPLDETVRAMSDLVTQGKVRYWGTSEWAPPQIREAYRIAESRNLHPPSVEQPEYNLFRRERVEVELAPLYRRFGIGVTSWSPLASGMLTGKYDRRVPRNARLRIAPFSQLRDRLKGPEGERQIAKVRELAAVASTLGVTRAQLAIAWCLQNPNVTTVILGASHKQQLEENLLALIIARQLDRQTIRRIETIAAQR
jgi:voltage-dependent potassium channel beta subunit